MKIQWLVLTALPVLVAPSYAQEALIEGDIVGALILAEGTVAVAEEDRIHFIEMGDPANRRTITSPFARVTHLSRAPDGDLVVWDDSLWVAFVFNADGEERRLIPFPKPGIGGGTVTFTALLADDVGLFAEADPGDAFAPTAGPSRNPVIYTTYARDGTLGIAWQALGKERSVHQVERGMSSAPVIFGYDVLAAAIDGAHFLVAQTEADEAVVVGPGMTEVASVPLPPTGPDVSPEQIEQERARLIALYNPGRRASILSTILSDQRVAEAMAGLKSGRLEALRAAPANSIPPRITDLRVDSGHRTWMRQFVLPGDTMATWDVRSLTGDEIETLLLPANWVVFDATDDGRPLIGLKNVEGAVTVVHLRERPVLRGSH